MRAIGIHTTGHTVRVAELVREGAGMRIARLESLTPGTAESAPGEGEVTLSEPRRNGINRCSSLPAIEVLTRVWTLPAVAPAKLRALVSHRLEVDLPIPLDELIWDCRAVAAEGGSASVLAQAVRRERLARHVETLRRIHLTPHMVTTEAEAIASLATHALGLTDAPAPTALILAAEGEWLIALLSGDLTLAVRRIGLDPAAPDRALRETRQIIAAQCGQTPLRGFYWLGETAADELLGQLAESLSAPLHAAVVDLRGPDGQPLRPDHIAEFGPAIGLALTALHRRERVIHLGGEALENAAGSRGRLDRLLCYPKTIVCTAAVLLAAALGIHFAALRAETARMQAHLQVATTRPADDLDTRVRAMQRLMQYRIDIEPVMAEIARVLPDTTLISSVQLSRERRLVLKGTSSDPRAAFTLADVLAKSPRFANVRPERVNPAQGGEFTVTADVTGIRKLSGLPERGSIW